MTEARVFTAFAIVFFLLLLYWIQLFLFFSLEKKRFLHRNENETYLRYLKARYRRAKRKRTKNLLLYYMIQFYMEKGEESKARQLQPFLKNDSLFGIQALE